MPLLDGKRVLITGAARGIGLAAATAMIDEGAEVVVTDIDSGELAQAKERLQGHGNRCRFMTLDVREQESVAEVVAALKDRWSGLDVLVNNAAVLDRSSTQNTDFTHWQSVLDTNLSSALRVTQTALPLLRKGTGASVINTTSTQAFFAQPQSVAYASAKGGLASLTRCMATDLGADGVRVNAVAPGFIDTRMALTENGDHEHADPDFKRFYLDSGRIPLRRAGTPGDCAGAYVFLASTMSAYITGQTIIVDGGLVATY